MMSGTDYPEAPDFDPTVPDTEDGAQVLDDVRAFLARFIAFPSDHALNAAVLWAAHTHALQAFECTPRIAFLSPEPGSGKTRALEILELLVLRPLLTVNVTPAYLFRKVADEAGPPTLLYDEIDTVFGPRAKDNEDIRGMLNAGYRRGATAGRCVIRGKTVEVEELPAFAAVALAGLDDLPDTISSRSILVRMRRRAPHERVESYRRRLHEDEGHELRDRLGACAASHWHALTDAWPELPQGIEDRNADVWEPLLAIADAAGGHWPETARRCAVAFVADSRDKAGGFGIQLLTDLRTAFAGEQAMTTEAILDALNQMDESPWGDIRGKALDSRGLSRRLAKYGIKPKVIRVGERTPRGYDRGDLLDAWDRYLPDEESCVVADVADVAPKEGEECCAQKPPTTKADPTHPGNMQQGATLAPLSPQLSATSATLPGALFTPPTGPGRCSGCGFHTPTMGHRDGCEAAA